MSQVMELKNKCDAIEKRESEKRQLEEKKHQEELQALKKTNQQLKVLHSSSHMPFSFIFLGPTGRYHSTPEEINVTISSSYFIPV